MFYAFKYFPSWHIYVCVIKDHMQTFQKKHAAITEKNKAQSRETASVLDPGDKWVETYLWKKGQLRLEGVL